MKMERNDKERRKEDGGGKMRPYIVVSDKVLDSVVPADEFTHSDSHTLIHIICGDCEIVHH